MELSWRVERKAKSSALISSVYLLIVLKQSQLKKDSHLYLHSTIKQGPGTMAQAYNPSTLGGRGGWITRSRDRDYPGQRGKTPSLLKIQKLAGHACSSS